MPAVAAAEERWRLTTDNAPVGIALVALDGTWLRVNAALCQMLGYAPEELRVLTFQDITHPDDLRADLALLGQLVAGQIPRDRMRERYFHAEGHEVPVDLSEEMRSAARIAQMNEALLEQTRRLQASNADLEAFAMLLSHDLQSPLGTLVGYLQLLEDQCGERLDENAADWVRRASAAAVRMSELVSSLLMLSRWTTVTERVPVFLGQLVDEVSDDLGPRSASTVPPSSSSPRPWT